MSNDRNKRVVSDVRRQFLGYPSLGIVNQELKKRATYMHRFWLWRRNKSKLARGSINLSLFKFLPSAPHMESLAKGSFISKNGSSNDSKLASLWRGTEMMESSQTN
jgi:hypothetical protein